MPNAPVSDTRAVTIDAPPSAVWPWLVQMGFGRGGWYSYDVVDMKGKSAERILPEFQTLTVGDIAPTHPGGGFEVKASAGHAWSFTSIGDGAFAGGGGEGTGRRDGRGRPVNLQAAGALMGTAQPTEFAASWAFVVEPLADDRTRLIERFRIKFDDDDRPWTRFTLPFMGFGVFVMVRQQLLGISPVEKPSGDLAG